MRSQVFALSLTALLLASPFADEAMGQTTSQQRAQQLFEQAQAHEKSKEFDLAVRKINEAIAIDAGDDQYLAYAAHVEHLAGRYADGAKHALQAIELNPKVGWYYAIVAFNANANQDLETAREYSRKAIKLGPKQVGQVNFDICKRIADKLARAAPAG